MSVNIAFVIAGAVSGTLAIRYLQTRRDAAAASGHALPRPVASHHAPAGRIIAAIRSAGLFLRRAEDGFARLCRRLSGGVEFSASVRRRGHLGPLAVCRVCRIDVHDAGEMCPEQKAASCSACGHDVLLDYWLNHFDGRGGSDVQTTHRISNIHPTTESEWRRLLMEQRIARRLRRCA